ncbi:TPA_asm: hypothetical protein G3V16_002595 [Salmonella enterica subsp. enterica serovar Brandenburg]|nr:hypothetical protein [Salmonella enterica subsp. enterica serovar Brandenburg]HAE8037908.1 hypothetical protein [Salmonella enterica subsp. enterica serovar Brandenburg]
MLPVPGQLTPACCLATRNNTMYAKSFMVLDGNGRLAPLTHGCTALNIPAY